MTEIIESYKESFEKDVIGAVQGTYKFKMSLMNRNFEKEKAMGKSINWGISQVEKGISKYFTWEDAENSLREMSEIATVLADKCENHLSIT